MDSVGCIIDNAVIYLCFLSYSEHLSLSELNILCAGSMLLSSGMEQPVQCLVFGPAERFRDVFWKPHMAWRVSWAGAGDGLPQRSSGVCCGARAWCLGAGLCSLHEVGARDGAAARKPGSPDGDLAALLEGTWELHWHWRLTVARIAIALCLLSSHLGCQMCPIVGQDSWDTAPPQCSVAGWG